MASDSNSDSEDLVLIGARTSRKRKSTNNLDDDLDDLLLDNINSKKRQSLIMPTNATTPQSSSNLIKQNRKILLSDKIDRLCEYAQVLMHCLLFKINYYNKKTHFDKLLKYNTIVYVRNNNNKTA